jgi:diacylglycerol kinase family enzyme
VIEKETHRRKAMLVSLANSNQFGYGTIIAPDASLTDGLLDIVLVQKFPAWEVPLIMHKTFRNKINQSKYVETLHASELVIYRDKGKRVNIDGEAVKMGKRLEIKVHPLSLNIIIPKNNNI